MTSIEICGGIAYGKTTLAHLLRDTSLTTVLENFEENPFYSAFYQDPNAVAFETEVTFSLQHYHQIKRALISGDSFCTDFSPYLDLAYSRVNLRGEQLGAYLRVYDVIRKEVGHPSVLIHLHCDPEIALSRIRRRGRSAELGITLEYLVALDDAIEAIMNASTDVTCILTLDSQLLDFVSNDHDRERALAIVRAGIQHVCEHAKVA